MHLCTRSHLSLKLSGSYHWLLLQHPLEHLIHTLNLMCTKQNSIIPRNYVTFPNSGGSSIFPLAQAKVWYSFLSPPYPSFSPALHIWFIRKCSLANSSQNTLMIWLLLSTFPDIIQVQAAIISYMNYWTNTCNNNNGLCFQPWPPPPPKVCYQHSSQSDPLKCKWHHANPLLKTLQIPLSFTQIEFLSARYYIICLFSAFSNLFFSSFLNPYIYTQFPVSLMVKTQHFHCGGLGSVSFGELRSLKPCQVAKNK